MKRFIFAAVAVLIGVLAFNAKADTPINPSDLPAVARSFISKAFPNDPIVLAERDKDLLRTEYSVNLQSGTEIDFDAKGEWRDVSCKHGSGVPASVVPKSVGSYVAANYPGQKIVEISRDRKKIEVELSSGLDLEFDANGNFLRIDD